MVLSGLLKKFGHKAYFQFATKGSGNIATMLMGEQGLHRVERSVPSKSKLTQTLPLLGYQTSSMQAR